MSIVFFTKYLQARVSINRIKEFFSLPELEEDAVIRGDNSNPFALEIRDGEFSWDRENSSESILQGYAIFLCVSVCRLSFVLLSYYSSSIIFISFILNSKIFP